MKERVTSTSSGQMHKPPEWLVRAVRVHTLSPFGRSENVLETFPAISMWPSGPSQFDAYNSGMSRRTEKVFISLLGGQAHLQFAASASTFELESCAPHTARQTVSVGISSDVQSHARVAGKAGQRRDAGFANLLRAGLHHKSRRRDLRTQYTHQVSTSSPHTKSESILFPNKAWLGEGTRRRKGRRLHRSHLLGDSVAIRSSFTAR